MRLISRSAKRSPSCEGSSGPATVDPSGPKTSVYPPPPSRRDRRSSVSARRASISWLIMDEGSMRTSLLTSFVRSFLLSLMKRSEHDRNSGREWAPERCPIGSTRSRSLLLRVFCYQSVYQGDRENARGNGPGSAGEKQQHGRWSRRL